MFKSYDEGVLKRLQKAELSILMDFDRVCEAYGIRYFLVGGTLIGAVRHKGFIPWDDDLDVGMTRADYKKFVKIMEKELGKEYILATPVRYPGYCGGVIKVMRKNTKFVPGFWSESECWLGINIDIFVWDNLSDSRIGAFLQIIETRILSQLIFLCGSSKPNIEFSHPTKFILQKACELIHWILHQFPGCARYLYQRMEKVSMRANHKQTKYKTSFATTNAYREIIRKEEFGRKAYLRKEFEGFEAFVLKNHEKYLEQRYGKNYMELPPADKRVNHNADMIEFGNIY